MADVMETRSSLLVRLRDRTDRGAWGEFVEVYRPAVWRLARRKGLQAADADDVAQQTMAAIARAIDRWQTDAARGRFRTWLHRIACNCLINVLQRDRRGRGSGDSGVAELLAAQLARTSVEPAEIDWEYRREVFQKAAREIRGEFHADTWSAFWRTAVEGADPASVAVELSRSVGAIYAARSRVMRRLRDQVARWEFADDQDE